MHPTKLFAGLFAVSLFAGVAAAQATYTIDTAHSAAHFSVRHLMVSTVRGQFTDLKGTLVYDPNNLAASRVEAVIDAKTISTRNTRRDDHLRGPDFFDVAKYPTLEFKSKQVYKNGGQLQMKGDLTIRGVTKEVVFDIEGPTPEVKDQRGSIRIGATATAKINRKDWGVNWNQVLEAGGITVGEGVTLTIDIEAIKQQAPAGSN